MQKKVSIIVFDDVEVLDFCGPFEAFSVAGFREGLHEVPAQSWNDDQWL